jgi:Ran GTPase-activating protein (RanGAP) involved in mRNA processing and transport
MAETWRAVVDRVLREGEEQLDLSSLFLGAEEAAEVAEKLRGSSNSVRKLALHRNQLGDGGARAVAELLRSNPPALVEVNLSDNNIGVDGISALADALRDNTAVRDFLVAFNKGVDGRASGSKVEAAAGIDSLVAAIGVNTTLEEVCVANVVDPPQGAIDDALEDTEGRRSGRERFLTGPVTKAARKSH